MKKRVLSMLMALTLCLTTLPTAVFADVTENGEGSGGTHYVAESGGTQYETVQEILDNMEEGEITLLDSVTEDLTVYAATTIHMNGHSITGNIDATDSLTLNGGTVDGTVKVYGGTLNMTAPAEAEAAITGGLNVVSGSAFVSGAQVGVKGTLYFDGTDMLIFGAVKAVELDSAAEPAAKTLYGSATVNGDTAAEAGFDTDTYKVGGEIAKKLTNKQVGSTTPAAPSLTLTETSKSLTAGKTAVFTANYTGTDTLNAYVQGSAVNGYFTISQKNNGDGTYTVSVKIDEETPGGTYTLFVHELGNTSVQASATITVTGLPDAAEVNGKQYKSLPAALNAAQNGDTVKLLADHVTDADALNALGEDFTFEQYASIVPVVTKTLTLDLNHKTVDYLEVGFTETNEETQKKETLATGNLTVTGEAAYGRISNLMFMAGALDIRSGEIGGSEGAGLVCDVNSGTATISNGTVYGLTVSEGASVTVKGGSNHAGEWVVASSATLNITDGTFGDVQFTHNGTIAISGGTFKSIKSYIAEELQPLMSLLDTQKVHAFYKGDDVQNGNATELADVTVKEHTHAMVNNKCACGLSCTHTNTEGASTIGKDGKCTACGTQFAAVIGETYYTDVPSALNAAADGQTVKLLANEALPSDTYVSKTLTLDLDGHSLDGYSLNVGGLTATSQVRTGKLTVVDSSGGNGAVGVTVRDGGKVEFRGSIATSCLRLQVYGGDVKFYGGNIRSFDLYNSVTYADFLPEGYCYYNYSGSGSDLGSIVTAADVANAVNVGRYLAVAPCSHGGANGFDGTNCPYCNAPAVAETALNNGEGNRPWRRFADLQTALDADRAGGAEFKLLADVTGDYTINGTQDTGLDLNGHSIKGTVTVKGTKGDFITTTLSNTKNTTTASIDKVVACDGAELAGSKYPAVIGELTLAEGATWKTILNDTALGYKVLNADGTHKWYARDDVNGSQLNNVIINRLPITSKNLAFKVNGTNVKGNKVERGTTVQLCASCNANDVTVTLSILKTGETTPITLSGNDVQYTTVGTGTTKFYVAEYAFNDVGSYTISFTATKDGYTVTSTPKKLTVTKPNLSHAEITFPDGNEAAFNYATATGVPTFVVTYKGTELKENVDFVITRGASTYDVGPCTLTIEATDKGDYTGSKSAQWNVRPLKVAASVGDIIKTYDGTTDLPANAKITFKSADSYYTGTTLRLAKGTDYEVLNAHYDSADASETEKTVSFTIELKNKGYVFDDGTTQKDFTLNGADFDDKTFQINKATAPMNNPIGTLNIINGTCQTYTYDFNNILPGLPGGKYGTISYGQADISLVSQSGYYYDETIVEFKKGVLTLAQFYAKDGKKTGQIGTVKVKVTTTNYKDFQLKLVLNAVNQIKPTPDGTITASEITYGDTLSKSEISGKMKDRNTGKSVNGTFAWTDGTIKPAASDNYEAEWTFTPAAGYEKYATVTGTVTIKVKPAKLIVSVKASSMYYTGEEQIASIIASGQSVDSTPVTFTYSDKVDGNYTSGVPTFTDAGTYTAYYKAEAANHEPATGTFTVTIDPLPISLLSVSSISKTYDGSADVTLTADKLTFFSKTANIKLPDTALTFSDAQFTSKQEDGSYLPSPEVGNGKALSFTMTLTSKNYVFEGESEGTTEVSDVFATDDANRFTITKAAAPTNIQSGTLTITNGLHKTYSFDLSTLLPKLTAPCDYGTITYDKKVDTNLGVGSFITLVNGKTGELTLEANRSGTDEGQFGAITVTISTSNYQDITLTVNIFAKNKLTPVMDGKITASKITYGQALSDSSITGKMKDPNTGDEVNGTFTWTDGAVKPDANDRYEAEWTFTPDSEEYATVTDTATVEVAPKSIEGAVITLESADLEYNAAEQSPKITGVALEKWTENITYRIVSGNTATNVNDSLTLTIEGTGNYTGKAAVKWKITPREVTPAIEVASCTYTGDALEPTVTLKDGNEVIPTDEYTVEYSNNTNAGTGRVTIKDVAGGNYVIKEKTQDFTITKAAAPTNIQSGTLTITNGLHKTYSFDLSTLLPKLTAPCDYGTITYDRKVDTNLGVGSFITLVDGKTGELTLDANRSGTDEGQFGTITVTVSTSNYQDIILTINVIAKNRITPTGTPTLSKNAITYGDALNTIALSGKLHDNVNNVDVDGTFEWVDGTHIPVVGNGTYAAEWIFEPTDTEKYLTVSGRSNITVEKAQPYGKVSMAGYTYGKTPSTPTLTDRTGDLNAQVTYRYAAADSGSVQTWDISNPPALNAGTYRMYASIGDTDNYYGFEAVYCEFVVAKATPTYTVPTGLTAKYGQTLADVTLPDGWSWMDSSESVGGASTAAKTFQAKFTPKDTKNYNTVENIELEVTVNKADGGNLKTVELEQKYTDASDHTYTPDWAGLPAGQDWTFSSEASIVLSKQDFAADGSLLTYAISGGKAGDKITITLKASCDNYEDFTITLNVTLTEKDDQKPLTITGAGSVVYGQTLTLTTTGGSGTGTVTYRIDTDASTGEATIYPETGVLTPVKVGSVSVIATKAGDNDYNDVTSAPFVLMIKPATPTGEPKYTAITTSGKTLKDAALTTKGSTLNPSDGKLEWVDDKGELLPDDTTVKANTTYKWRFTPDDDNYTTLTGEVELYHKSSSGGGWYDSYYTIKATAGTGGSISPSGSVSVREGRDQTFTITPDKSYAVANVKIDGKSIGTVKSYTFENVRRTHTIEVIFMKANGNPQTGVFVDVATGSYYEDAVDWAVGNGITQGTDDTHFSPDGICTRAQAVAFLWRAAGSPKPETRTMPFTDVPAGSYYYDAVLWAVENDITKGTSDTTFSPNMTCTRAQIVAFLWRSEKSPAAGTDNPFADVKSAAYYADAVLWAAKKDITKGTTNTTFSPDADCTRAQIVTFLWRCKK
ncbi:MAG: S-layer homology domain-containing protein [Oscillibacter sp.]